MRLSETFKNENVNIVWLSSSKQGGISFSENVTFWRKFGTFSLLIFSLSYIKSTSLFDLTPLKLGSLLLKCLFYH